MKATPGAEGSRHGKATRKAALLPGVLLSIMCAPEAVYPPLTRYKLIRKIIGNFSGLSNSAGISAISDYSQAYDEGSIPFTRSTVTS